ncbi:MAG: hypothetical protein KME38_02915 [Spirirestis rafaelensis WJT71-NPBG6]|jgi:hypothetical protein|nr:hypothetical protein [Spirirestis rafaelensis WJT71-NPBG6]
MKLSKVKLTLQRVSTVNRTLVVLNSVKFLPSQFLGEKAHSNPIRDSQPGENGYQTWSVHGVKAAKTTSPKPVVEAASSVEPINESELAVRIVVTPKSRANGLKRGERNMLRRLMNELLTFIQKKGFIMSTYESKEPLNLPANRQVSKPQSNGQWERVKPIFSLERSIFEQLTKRMRYRGRIVLEANGLL